MLEVAAISAQGLLDSIAVVNTRLYGQLLAQRRPVEELGAIRRAYDLTSVLYSGAYQGDGRPFTAHVVSVASILALIGMPSNIVAAGLIHNVYGNGNFGDGHAGATRERRQRVRDAVGEDIEDCVYRFRDLRVTDNPGAIKRRLPSLDARERMLVAMDLADLLDKYADLGVLYFGNAEWVTGFVDAHEPDLIEVCRDAGQPVLAQALELAIARVRSTRIPAALRSAPDRKYVRTTIPLSCMERPKLTWTRAIKQSAPWRLARSVIRGTPA